MSVSLPRLFNYSTVPRIPAAFSANFPGAEGREGVSSTTTEILFFCVRKSFTARGTEWDPDKFGLLYCHAAFNGRCWSELAGQESPQRGWNLQQFNPESVQRCTEKWDPSSLKRSAIQSYQCFQCFGLQLSWRNNILHTVIFNKAATGPHTLLQFPIAKQSFTCTARHTQVWHFSCSNLKD